MDFRLPPRIEDLPLHRPKLEAICRFAVEQPEIAGMSIAGSFATGQADVYSDLDLRLYVEDDAHRQMLARSRAFADAGGSVVAAFTGEHVGEPRLLIVLYEDLTHVDLVFIEVSEVGRHNQGLPALVLWERDGRVSAQLPGEHTPDPAADLAWMEARMWTWSWYIQAKILRGELYEALDGLQFVRSRVLFPLLSMTRAARPAGSRRAEQFTDEWTEPFAQTVGALDRDSLLHALRSAMRLYVALGDPLLARHGVEANTAAREVALGALGAGLAWRPDPPPVSRPNEPRGG